MKIDHYLSNITLEFHYFRFQGEYKREAALATFHREWLDCFQLITVRKGVADGENYKNHYKNTDQDNSVILF